MSRRRILSLWFPRLGAERLLRQARGTVDAPFAVVADSGNMQILSSLDARAEAEGLRVGQGLRDACAMCPGLVTRLRNEAAEAAFLDRLQRWAGRFSPWVAAEPPAALLLDLTGCAHLFGGEAQLLERIGADCDALHLTVQAGVADTVGAAWALAHHAGHAAASGRSGDAIDQEAYATRSRAAKRRHWERGGAAPALRTGLAAAPRIAPPGQTRQAIGALPVAALRLEADTVAQLGRLGLRRVDDLASQPRAALARRFGRGLVRRLDQALGIEPEPVSPAAVPDRFAVRLTLPEPIGLESDMAAALDRLLPPLCARLEARGRGARRVRLQCFRADQTMQWVEVGLARPTHDPDRIRPLLAMKLAEIDAGFGIDVVRLDAALTEPVSPRQHRGHAEAAEDARARGGAPLDDLIGRMGARIGLDAITRRHPADSHIPEKGSLTLAAAWSEPAGDWPTPPVPRPLSLWPPEPVTAPEAPQVPGTFRWRGRDLATLAATGPERIAPEWWLDDPGWRSGVRDYWRVTCESGDRLWLYYAHGAATSPGWFCQGAFA